jgi:hypothetical protein
MSAEGKDGNYTLDSEGILTANGAFITGDITATGTIESTIGDYYVGMTTKDEGPSAQWKGEGSSIPLRFYAREKETYKFYVNKLG